MKKLASLFLLLFAAAASHAQTTQIIANNIAYFGGAQVTGSFCVSPTDQSGNALTLTTPGGQQLAPSTPLCFPIVNGVLSAGAVVPDTSQTQPANACLRVSIYDRGGTRIVGTYPCIQPQGATWSFDAYVPSTLPTIPALTLPQYQVNGTPLTLQSVINFVCSGCTNPSAGNITLPIGNFLPRTYFTVGTGGVTANQIVSYDSSGNVIAATGTGFGGLAAATATVGNTVEVVRSGIGTCVFDGTAVVGDIATPSTTTIGRCHDSGVIGSLNVPNTTPVIGVIESAAGTAGSTGTIRLHGPGAYGDKQAGPTFPVNAKTATYQVLTSDFQSCESIPVGSGTFTLTLVASTSQPPAGQCVIVVNYGTGVVTIARNGQNLNGGTASLTLPASSPASPTGAIIVSDGTNYFAGLWGAASGGLIAANNLSDLANASTARGNLGLGSAATATAPAGAIVGTTDAQTLTNKTVDGVTPTTMGYLDATSSIQTQINTKAPLASPVLTGTPTAPTQTCGNNTNIATGAYLINCDAWSLSTAPNTNLSLSMGAYTSTFTFNAATGTADLFKLTDTLNNTGTGIMAHYATASGSTEIPWQADANGVGWRINSLGQLQSVGSSLPGAEVWSAGSGTYATLPTNSYGWMGPATGGTSYLMQAPATMTNGFAYFAAPVTQNGVPVSQMTPATAIQASNPGGSNGQLAFAGVESHIGSGPATPTTVLVSGAITISATSMVVGSATGWPTSCSVAVPCYAYVGTNLFTGEIMSITGVSGTTFTIGARGMFGTTAAAQGNNGDVMLISYLIADSTSTLPTVMRIYNGSTFFTPSLSTLTVGGYGSAAGNYYGTSTYGVGMTIYNGPTWTSDGGGGYKMACSAGGATLCAYQTQDGFLTTAGNHYYLTSDQTITSTSLAATNYTFTTIQAYSGGRTVSGRCLIPYQQLTAAAGVQFGIKVGLASTALWVNSQLYTSTSGSLNVQSTAVGTSTTATAITAVGTPGSVGTTYMEQLDFVWTTGGQSSNDSITIYALTSNASDSLVLKAGGKCTLDL